LRSAGEAASGHTNVNASGKYRWLLTVIVFGVVYLLVGVGFPNPPASDKMQFMWRLAAWLISAAAFAVQIGYEHFRLHNSPARIALHASMAVALGAFGLATAANTHALHTATGNRRSLALALVIWPIMSAVPAFLVALGIAFGIARMRPNDKVSST